MLRTGLRGLSDHKVMTLKSDADKEKVVQLLRNHCENNLIIRQETAQRSVVISILALAVIMGPCLYVILGAILLAFF